MKKVRSIFRWMAKTVPRMAPDALAAGGAACVGYGAFLIAPVVGWIATGVLLIAAAVIVSKGGGGG
ncbi:MAG: hypothetical protein VB035_10060 [Candidatus Fimivivens sp.]|nr:hypothetical protein [Candidatus Fimivivens sp.]